MPKKLSKKSVKETEIVATSQTSRFHNETLETLSKDLDLKQVHISAGTKDLLVNADLRLFSGVNYGLIGPNGCGKTTVLKCIGYKKIPGIQANLRSLYVEQISLEDGKSSVLEVVVNSDKDRVRLAGQLSVLERALGTGNGMAISKAVKFIKLERQKEALRNAHKTALERSGARGFKARKQLNAEEDLLRELEAVSLEETEADANDVVLAQEMLGEVTDSLSIYDPEEVIRANASKILTGLGFSEEMQKLLSEILSGGWKIRASLASALLIKPDLLLLDEPTNHLDLPTVLWLQHYLTTLSNVTLVIVSHNRSFLNAVTEETIVCREQRLDYFAGNYDDYLADYTEKQRFLKTKADAVERKKEASILSIEKALSAAKKSGDDKKVQNMVSKKKKLDRLGMDVNEKGHRFKLNRDRQGYHNDIRDDVEVDKQMTPQNWKVEQPYSLRYQGDVIVMNDVGFKYSSTSQVIFGRVSLSVSQKSRIAIVGANGTGKSTLMKLLTGELKPTVGTVQWPGNAQIGVFSQFNAEEFQTGFDEDATALSAFIEKYPDRKEQQYRAHLGKFGIKGNTAVKPLIYLSGGELARVKLALNFFDSSPHILILDEPTNHLDMLSIDSLAQMLESYDGAVIVASHDQHFLSKVAKQVYTFEKKQLKRLDSVQAYVDGLKIRS